MVKKIICGILIIIVLSLSGCTNQSNTVENKAALVQEPPHDLAYDKFPHKVMALAAMTPTNYEVKEALFNSQAFLQTKGDKATVTLTEQINARTDHPYYSFFIKYNDDNGELHNALIAIASKGSIAYVYVDEKETW